jgi:hypothetical protein
VNCRSLGYPGFPVELGGVVELHAPFLTERRTRGPVLCCVAGNPASLGMTKGFSAAPTALDHSSSSTSQPFRAGLTFGSRPSGPCICAIFAVPFHSFQPSLTGLVDWRGMFPGLSSWAKFRSSLRDWSMPAFRYVSSVTKGVWRLPTSIGNPGAPDSAVLSTVIRCLWERPSIMAGAKPTVLTSGEVT